MDFPRLFAFKWVPMQGDAVVSHHAYAGRLPFEVVCACAGPRGYAPLPTSMAVTSEAAR